MFCTAISRQDYVLLNYSEEHKCIYLGYASGLVSFIDVESGTNEQHFEEIDQDSGEITDTDETPYHSSQNIRLPIRVINNGTQVLLNSGGKFAAILLNYQFPEVNFSISFISAYFA